MVERNIKQLLNGMSLEQKVGQLFILAFAGEDPDYPSYLVRERHVGGFYLTDDNAASPQQARELTASLQFEASLRPCDAPLILAVDQEGAWGILTQHLELGPGNLALGKAGDTALTQQMYHIFASQVGALGYNCILGPCADVNANPDNPIIGQRSFGDIPHHVSEHVTAAIKGIDSGNLLSCAKHFPGHGDTSEDSHQTLPSVDKPLEVLRKTDLLPFQQAVSSGVDMIMTSHICYPQIDMDNPATLSKNILTELLQQDMGFNGLIITDSMNMWAMRRRYDPVDAAIRALEAGAHLIMLSEEHYENQTTDYKALQQQTLDGMLRAVRQGRISETLLDERLTRVLAVRYGRLQQAPPDMSLVDAPSEIAARAAKKAIRVLANRQQLLPLQQQAYFVPLANPANFDKLVNSRGIGPNDPRAASNELYQAMLEQGAALEKITFTALQRQLHSAGSDWQDRPVIAVWEDYPLPGEDFDPGQQQRLKSLLQCYPDNLIVACLGPDYPLSAFPGLQTCVCTYSSRRVAALELARFLLTLD
ncbi:glycoside hydrolase family 3 protein [Lacimicrobium alkaliphilum]|uniref:Beta-N-acetylhexosaminidase n=1 Tax=Lacimicrobium alkaliphilum TaxID=1526571 RepID=A0ABQ1RP51_9ALTE|nr:glycoside hydrolase family 3 N-terminal domain-containing protein [Lacimicrobium alkaliphilum]GGD74810.1 beta-N-acetylhexosaminidase [Lacimicrobium alkaliphilum]